jgi:hypothetical protein
MSPIALTRGPFLLPSIPSSQHHNEVLRSPPQRTPRHRRDTNGNPYVTLTVSSPSTTYETAVLLGDSFPTSSAAAANPSPSPAADDPPSSGLSNSATVGIVVGCVCSFVLLMGVLYVYLLRARQLRKWRRRWRRKKRKRRRQRAVAGVSGFILFKMCALLGLTEIGRCAGGGGGSSSSCCCCCRGGTRGPGSGGGVMQR